MLWNSIAQWLSWMVLPPASAAERTGSKKKKITVTNGKNGEERENTLIQQGPFNCSCSVFIWLAATGTAPFLQLICYFLSIICIKMLPILSSVIALANKHAETARTVWEFSNTEENSNPTKFGSTNLLCNLWFRGQSDHLGTLMCTSQYIKQKCPLPMIEFPVFHCICLRKGVPCSQDVCSINKNVFTWQLSYTDGIFKFKI